MITYNEFIDRLFNAKKLSIAGEELWTLFNCLADDYEGNELLGKLECYVADYSQEVNDLYYRLSKWQDNKPTWF